MMASMTECAASKCACRLGSGSAARYGEVWQDNFLANFLGYSRCKMFYSVQKVEVEMAIR